MTETISRAAKVGPCLREAAEAALGELEAELEQDPDASLLQSVAENLRAALAAADPLQDLVRQMIEELPDLADPDGTEPCSGADTVDVMARLLPEMAKLLGVRFERDGETVAIFPDA